MPGLGQRGALEWQGGWGVAGGERSARGLAAGAGQGLKWVASGDGDPRRDDRRGFGQQWDRSACD